MLVALAFAVSPFLSPEFGGFDPNRYPIPQIDPPVQPAGWAFAIWGVIYPWLLIHTGYGLWARRENMLWDDARLPLGLSLLVGAAWLPVALISPLWATLMIWIMLISAIIAVDRMRAAKPRWASALPLGLYAGWLSAASFVAVGLLGAGYGVVFGETGWAVLCLSLALVFAVCVQLRLEIWTYGFAVTWGFCGIVAQNIAPNPVLAALAGVAALLMAGLTIGQRIQR